MRVEVEKEKRISSNWSKMISSSLQGITAI